jgi:hypothetical protein
MFLTDPFCWTAKRSSWFKVFFSSSAADSWVFEVSSFNSTQVSHYSLENVAASDLRILNSLRKLHIVSLTTTFSFSYFDLILLSATSAVFQFDLGASQSAHVLSTAMT